MRGFAGPLLVLAVVVAAYARGLGGYFLGEDFPVVAFAHRAPLDPVAWLRSFVVAADPDAQGHMFYRPLAWISFALDARAFGTWAPGYRTVALGLYAAACIAWSGAVRRWTGDRRVALAAAVVFALFPTHPASVMLVNNRGDLLALAFGTLALFLARSPRRTAREAAAPLVLLCAMWSKEWAVALAPFVALGAWLGARPESRARAALPALLVAVAYLALRWAVLGTLGGGYGVDHWEGSWLEKRLAYPLALLCPLPFEAAPAAARAAIAAGSAGLAVLGWRRLGPRAGMTVLAAVLAGFAPYYALSFDRQTFANVHYVLAASLGWSVLVGAGLVAVARRRGWAVVLVALAGLVGALVRNQCGWIEAGATSRALMDAVQERIARARAPKLCLWRVPTWKHGARFGLDAWPALAEPPFGRRRPDVDVDFRTTGPFGEVEELLELWEDETVGARVERYVWDDERLRFVPRTPPERACVRGRVRTRGGRSRLACTRLEIRGDFQVGAAGPKDLELRGRYAGGLDHPVLHAATVRRVPPLLRVSMASDRRAAVLEVRGAAGTFFAVYAATESRFVPLTDHATLLLDHAVELTSGRTGRDGIHRERIALPHGPGWLRLQAIVAAPGEPPRASACRCLRLE